MRQTDLFTDLKLEAGDSQKQEKGEGGNNGEMKIQTKIKNQKKKESPVMTKQAMFMAMAIQFFFVPTFDCIDPEA